MGSVHCLVDPSEGPLSKLLALVIDISPCLLKLCFQILIFTMDTGHSYSTRRRLAASNDLLKCNKIARATSQRHRWCKDQYRLYGATVLAKSRESVRKAVPVFARQLWPRNLFVSFTALRCGCTSLLDERNREKVVSWQVSVNGIGWLCSKTKEPTPKQPTS